MSEWTDAQGDALLKGREQGKTFREIGEEIGKSAAACISRKRTLDNRVVNPKEQVDYEKLAAALLKKASNQKGVHAPKPRLPFRGKLRESAVLQLSDVHVGKKNFFVDLDTGKSYETYNLDIMFEERDMLLESIQTVNSILAPSYDIEKLYIFATGDLVDNDIIVRGQRFYIDVGVGAQVTLACEMFTDFTLKLLEWYPEIEWDIVPGNHGRMTPRKEKHPFYNTFDYLFGKMLELRFRDEPRVTIKIPESSFWIKQIYRWRYYLHHGDVVWSWMGFPYYGLNRQSKGRVGELPYQIECLGHFHKYEEIPVNSTTWALLNGCWIEKDDYSWSKYAYLSWPLQRYFLVSPKRPVSSVWKLELKKGLWDNVHQLAGYSIDDDRMAV